MGKKICWNRRKSVWQIKKIANEELDASVNKIIDACIDDFEIAEKVVIYRKRKDEINVARTIIIRESI